MEITKLKGLEEIYKKELERVIENINDLSTDSKGVRKINLSISFTPKNEDRDYIDIKVSGKSSLTPIKTQEDTAFLVNGDLREIDMGPEIPFKNNIEKFESIQQG